MNSYDNSAISTFQKCPMSYYLQYILGLKKSIIDDTNAAMEFGSAVHTFLETLYGSNWSNQEIPYYSETKDLPQYSRLALQLLASAYIDKYKQKDFGSWSVQNIEKPISLKLGKYKFVVKLDASCSANGNIFGLEHKTTSSISYNYFDKFFLNGQISAQSYAINKELGQCSGIILNAIEIKSLKRKPTGNYDGVQQILDGWIACKFSRDYVNRTPTELEDWEENTISWINEIKRAKKNNIWHKSTSLWGGIICAKCQYKELCKVSRGTSLDESVKDCLYETVDPYAYLQEK